MTGVNVDLLDSNGVVLATREIQGIQTSWELDFGSVSGVATVRVTKPGEDEFLTLPEVEVLGSVGESLLTGSSVASQSSDLNCANCVNRLGEYAGLADLAIDGNTNGVFTWTGSNSVFHSGEQLDPWLQVDLGLTAAVSKVTVWNRTGCGERVVDAKILLKDASGNILHTETITSSGESNTFEFPPVPGVTSIRVARENVRDALVFAEVEAFGVIQ